MKDKETKEEFYRLFKIALNQVIEGKELKNGERDGLLELETYVSQLEQEAERRGYQNCLDDIWEEARGLRSFAEHDGSVSSADVEAGLQEAYLNIESKLKDNK